MLNRRIVSGILITVVTIGVFGGFFIARAVTIPPLKAGLLVWTVLSPIPRVVANDTRLLYVAVVAQASYGTAPYTIEVKIGASPATSSLYAYYIQQYSGTMAPVIWSENAPKTATSLYIQVLVADNASAISAAFTTITLPTS